MDVGWQLELRCRPCSFQIHSVSLRTHFGLHDFLWPYGHTFHYLFHFTMHFCAFFCLKRIFKHIDINFEQFWPLLLNFSLRSGFYLFNQAIHFDRLPCFIQYMFSHLKPFLLNRSCFPSVLNPSIAFLTVQFCVLHFWLIATHIWPFGHFSFNIVLDHLFSFGRLST